MIEDINMFQKLHVFTRRAQQFAALGLSASALTQATSTAANPTQASSTAANPTQATSTAANPTQATSTWAVTSEGPPTTGDVTNGAITAGAITNGAITAGAITNGAITAGAITNGAITSPLMHMVSDTAVELTKIGTLGLVGLKIPAVTTDIARDFLESPLFVDWTRDTYWRVGATAFTTPLVADAYGTTTAAQVKATPWGKLAKNTLPTQSINTYLTVDVNAIVHTFTGGALPFLLGYQIAYTPKFLGGKSYDLNLAAPTDA